MTDDRGAGNYLTNDTDSLSFKTVKVKCNTLDNFANENKLQRIDLIKADIEGEEFNLLSGALNTIRKCKPYMIFELDEKLLNRKDASIQKVISVLDEIDYDCFHILNTTDALLFPREKKNAMPADTWNYLEKYSKT